MIAVIAGLITSIIGLAVYFLKRRDKNEAPHDAEKDEFNKHLADGDALGLSGDFERVRDEIKDGDHPGGHHVYCEYQRANRSHKTDQVKTFLLWES